MWAISGTEVRHVAALIGERWHRLAAESDASSPPWPVEARAWAKTGAGGRSTGGWRRHRRISPLVYASQQAPSSSHGLEAIVTGE